MIQEEKIEIALNSIRPFLQRDGGDVELVSIVGDIVNVRLVGACETCSMQASTLKAGIEESIMNAIPEVKGVVSV